jgi:hypothetical protein
MSDSQLPFPTAAQFKAGAVAVDTLQGGHITVTTRLDATGTYLTQVCHNDYAHEKAKDSDLHDDDTVPDLGGECSNRRTARATHRRARMVVRRMLFLPYDMAAALHHWHSSMYDPIYSIGSCLLANACPDEWRVTELACWQHDTAGYWMFLPAGYDDALDRVASMMVDNQNTGDNDHEYTEEDASEQTDDDMAADAAAVFIEALQYRGE